ncbi:MAG: efflux RND transporter permease subunit, partial [Gammaproteobacteria bacterium]|nr:efflux RND transporter permease subunit [Gammaproteobacteria bacterium]
MTDDNKPSNGEEEPQPLSQAEQFPTPVDLQDIPEQVLQKASHSEAELGFAGRLADSFIHSPLSPLLFIAMMAVGVWGLIATPRQEDPQISVPMIDIFFPAPGLSSGEVANQVI